MASKYRLSAKPGLARVGRFVGTKVNPVIVRPNVVKLKPQNRVPPTPQQLTRKIPQNQRVQPVRIIKPVRSAIKPKIQININEGQRARLQKRKGVKASPIRNKKDLELSRFRDKVTDIQSSGVGRILIMIACGPSILEVDLPKLKEHKYIDLMSINKPDPRVHPTKYWVFCDQSQYARNKPEFDNFPNTIINAWSVRARHRNQILIRNKQGKGFSKDLHKGYFIGRSTTFANMQTALWMNYDKIFIFGCDMAGPSENGNLHFYGTNPDVDPKIRVTRFKKEAEYYSAGAEKLTELERNKFVFCSSYNKWAFVKKFQSLDQKMAVEHILGLADEYE